jgi:hypothetical protein
VGERCVVLHWMGYVRQEMDAFMAFKLGITVYCAHFKSMEKVL